MKIVGIETFLVPPRWLFCRIETDEGIVGWGEPVVEGRAETVRAAVQEMSDYLIGQDASRIEDHWQVLSKGGFYRGGPVLSSAVAGIDQALWDIAGKVYGAPVHALLGGPVRERIRMYAWAHGDSPEELAEAARERIRAGYTAVKICPIGVPGFLGPPDAISSIVDRVAAVREAIGANHDLAVDLHGRASIPLARQLLPLIAEHAPLFVEEPLRPELSDQIGRITAATTVPVATGERLYSRQEFRTVLEAGVAVVQPDASHAGGISEVRRIAALAEIYDAQLAPHCPLGPIALAASLQVAFATPNFLIQEQSMGIHYHRGSADLLDYVADQAPLRIVDGHIARWDAPGLGITIDEAAVRRADAAGHAWRNPVWRQDDGSFAEW
jgi:galactonate dehydratase